MHQCPRTCRFRSLANPPRCPNPCQLSPMSAPENNHLVMLLPCPPPACFSLYMFLRLCIMKPKQTCTADCRRKYKLCLVSSYFYKCRGFFRSPNRLWCSKIAPSSSFHQLILYTHRPDKDNLDISETRMAIALFSISC
jgi:hypothetical protein